MQITDWKKIFKTHLSDKGTVFRIQFLKILQFHSKINNSIFFKWAKDMNRHLPEEDTRMANKHMNRYSTSLFIRKMQIKITMNHHYTPIKLANIKDLLPYTAGRNIKKYHQFGKQAIS